MKTVMRGFEISNRNIESQLWEGMLTGEIAGEIKSPVYDPHCFTLREVASIGIYRPIENE